jgi:acyl-CoA dehydrogenase
MIKDQVLSLKEALRIAHDLKEIFQQRASSIDEAAVFPKENLELLKENGFMPVLIPIEFGGSSFGIEEVSAIAQVLAQGCLSTAIIWAMHCQQVSVLVNHTHDEIREEVLTRIANENHFVGSVTTEIGKGGHLLKSNAPLFYENEYCLIERMAPIVTGGALCDSYLITMKTSEDANDTDVSLVYALPEDLKMETLSSWETMGMRGTNSCAIKIKGSVKKKYIINPEEEFKDIAIKTMIPYGHVAWAACWYGAANGIFKDIIHKVFRDRKKRKSFNLNSDLFLYKLAKVQKDLDVGGTYLKYTVSEYATRIKEREFKKLFEPDFQLRINNLKIVCSETMFQAANELIDIIGMRYGYLKNPEIQLERLFRDLRSGALMYHNDRLYKVNGKLALISSKNS